MRPFLSRIRVLREVNLGGGGPRRPRPSSKEAQSAWRLVERRGDRPPLDPRGRRPRGGRGIVRRGGEQRPRGVRRAVPPPRRGSRGGGFVSGNGKRDGPGGRRDWLDRIRRRERPRRFVSPEWVLRRERDRPVEPEPGHRERLRRGERVDGDDCPVHRKRRGRRRGPRRGLDVRRSDQKFADYMRQVDRVRRLVHGGSRVPRREPRRGGGRPRHRESRRG
mmetsp:Transcript_11069/g.44586  ORF Transcript_11069/g.44586 Transcript_11069/m.44586 type:complete len:220 (+) Transcript_11069:732-1391(+)